MHTNPGTGSHPPELPPSERSGTEPAQTIPGTPNRRPASTRSLATIAMATLTLILVGLLSVQVRGRLLIHSVQNSVPDAIVPTPTVMVEPGVAAQVPAAPPDSGCTDAREYDPVMRSLIDIPSDRLRYSIGERTIQLTRYCDASGPYFIPDGQSERIRISTDLIVSFDNAVPEAERERILTDEHLEYVLDYNGYSYTARVTSHSEFANALEESVFLMRNYERIIESAIPNFSIEPNPTP